MRCDELKDLIQLGVVDLPGSEEEAAVREHLDGGCPRCAAELAAAREVVELLPFALRPEEPSPMAKARLMAAVKKEAKPVAPRVSWVGVTAASLAAALVAAGVTGALLFGRVASLARQMQEANQSIRLISSPGAMVVDLAGQGDRSGSAARVFWDPAGASWRLYAENLPAPPPGKTYQLWLIMEDGRKLSAGTFKEAIETAASGRATVPPDAGRVVAAAVTDEPEGGSPQPTGSILLLGKS